jgi:hypothetical protein
MADYRALAAVSVTLRNLLQDRMEAPPTMTLAPPDVTPQNVNGDRLNLYLYQVGENGSLKNQEIPGRGHPGDYGRPPLSLDLHYLLTVFPQSEDGETAEESAQEILGDAMRVLHEFPIVGPDLREGDNPAGDRILDPRLVGEFERIKICLEPATLDEFSKLWTALPEANFRRSVIYQVSVVQIESRLPRRAALPVRERAVTALPFHRPLIEEAFREPPIENVRQAVVEIGETLRIVGLNLAGAQTAVLIGESETPAPAARGTRIEVTVPTTLSAGVHLLEVAHDVPLSPGGAPHRLLRSNAVPVQVIPRIVAPLPVPAAAGDTITLNLVPNVLAIQSVALLLDDFVVPAAPVAPTAAPSATRQFTLPSGPAAIPTDTYFMRVRVDGAESRLSIDPNTHAYTGPTFTVIP